MKIRQTDLTMCSKFTQVVLFLLALAFLFVGVTGKGSITVAQDTISNVSFNTPEDAVAFYMQAVASGEIPEIMQVAAVDEMSQNFRFDLYVERIRILPPQAPAPSDYTFYREMNKAQFLWQILSQTRNLVYGLLATEKGLAEGETIRLLEPDASTTFVPMFITEVDPERLAQIEVVTIGMPYPEIVQSERNLEVWNTLAETWGADELTERVVLFRFEDEYYFVGFTLLRYGEDWKISTLSSPVSGASAFGTPTVTTEEAFQDMVDGN